MSTLVSFTRKFNVLGRRWNSTYESLLQRVKTGKEVDLSTIRDVIKSKEFKPEELTALKRLFNSNSSDEVINEILQHTLPQDFSLYFTLATERPSHVWNDHSLVSLLRSNPGRVYSLTDLLKKHGSESVSNEIRKVILEKLLHGEKSEVRDGEFELTGERINEAIVYLNQFSGIDEVTDYVNTIIDHVTEKGTYASTSAITVDGFADWLHKHKLANMKDNGAFLHFAEIIFNQDPQALAKHTLSDILVLEDRKLYPQKVEFFDRVLNYINQHQLDVDKRDAESLLLRIQLIVTYGINRDQIDVALEKFHHYQSHDKLGIELVQSKLVQAFCYQSFAKNDSTLLKIAESLIVVDELPVKTIAHLILASSRIEGRDLEIYNDYINKVSKKVNESTKRSPSGILTEAMMIASLYGNDREFAQLLFEKAAQGNIISDEMEIATMKKVFKVYGEAFEEDSWQSAEPKLAQYVLDTIKRL